DNHLTVQFSHRIAAYTLLAVARFYAVDCTRHRSPMHGRSAITLAFLLGIQAGIGIVTLLCHVPLLLAFLHQALALVRLGAATLHARDLRAAREGSAALDDWQRRSLQVGPTASNPAL